MSILGEHLLLDRLDRGMGLGMGLGPPPGFRPLTPRLWRPPVWGSPPPPPCPPPPVHSLPLCPEPCHLPAMAGVGVTHLFDYMASARLWYPWYYKGTYSLCVYGRSELRSCVKVEVAVLGSPLPPPAPLPSLIVLTVSRGLKATLEKEECVRTASGRMKRLCNTFPASPSSTPSPLQLFCM